MSKRDKNMLLTFLGGMGLLASVFSPVVAVVFIAFGILLWMVPARG